MVGRDLLVGTFCGVCVALLLQQVNTLAPAWFGRPNSIPLGSSDHWLNPLLGKGRSIGELCLTLIDSIEMGLLYGLLFFFLLRVVLRTERLAACAFVLFYTSLLTIAIGDPRISWLVNGLAVILFVVLLMRNGLLACIVLLFVQYCLRFPITFHTSAWYAGSGLFVLAMIAAVAVYGYYISLGGRQSVPD